MRANRQKKEIENDNMGDMLTQSDIWYLICRKYIYKNDIIDYYTKNHSLNKIKKVAWS